MKRKRHEKLDTVNVLRHLKKEMGKAWIQRSCDVVELSGCAVKAVSHHQNLQRVYIFIKIE